MNAVGSRVDGAHGCRPQRSELRGYFDVLLRDIRRQNSRILGLVAERGWLRDDVELERAVDTWEVISSVETYVRLVGLNGRSRTSTVRGSSRRWRS